MKDDKKNAIVFKAFSDENRLKIIRQLQKGETCACDLLGQMPISQSTLSHHMKILVESEIVSARKEGKWVYYSLATEGINQAVSILDTYKEIESQDNSNVCNTSCIS